MELFGIYRSYSCPLVIIVMTNVTMIGVIRCAPSLCCAQVKAIQRRP
jgi:hypothetical protein